MTRAADRTRSGHRRAAWAAVLVVALAGAFDPGRPAPRARARSAGIDGNGQTAVAIIDALGWASGASPSLTLRRQGASSDEPAQPFDVPAAGWRFAVLRAPNAAGRGVFAGRLDAGLSATVRSRHAWPATGGLAIDAPGDDSFSVDGAATADVWVPLAVAAFHGATSIVTVQNGNIRPAGEQVGGTFHVAAIPLGRTVPDVEADYTIPPGGSATLDLGADPAFATLRPNADGGFLGALRITSPSKIAVHAMIDVDGEAGVADFAGIPASSASTQLFVPLVHAALPDDPSLGPEATQLAVVNTRPVAGEVRLSYVGVGGTCAGRAFAHAPATLSGGSMVLFDQGDGAGWATGPSGLPAGCVAAALISADQPVVATLFARQSREGRTSAAATDALSRSGGGEPGGALIVPWFAEDGDGNALSSDVFVMNIGDQTAGVRVDLARPDGTRVDCGEGCRRLVEPWHAWRLRSDAVPAAFRASAGGAIVTADAAILAFVRSASPAGGDAALWPASALVGVDDDPFGPAKLLPFILRGETGNDASSPTPSSRPSPSPTPTSSPTPPPFRPGNGMAGGGASTLYMANLESAPAPLAVDLYYALGSRAGATRIQRDVPPVLPVAMPLAALDDVPLGRFSAIVNGGRAVGVAALTEWAGGAALISDASPEGFELAVPYAPLGWGLETGTLVVQNPAATNLAAVNVELRDDAGARVGGTTFSVGPHAVHTVALNGPAGFSGWARITGDRLFSAQLTVNAAASALGAFDVGAVRVADAARRVFAPRVSRRAVEPGALQGARRSTRLVVANPGPAAVLVRPTYVGTVGTCAGFRFTGAPFDVPAGANHILDLETEPALPDGCTAAATLGTLEGGLVGVAIDGVKIDGDALRHGGWTASAYPMRGVEEAGTRWLVPRVLTGGAAGSARRTTIVVMNAGEAATDIALSPRDGAGGALSCAACTAALAAGAAAAFDIGALIAPATPQGASVQITAGGPVVVVYAEASGDGLHDDAMAAALLVAPPLAVPPARYLVPELLKSAPTGPAPSATPSVRPTAAASAGPTTGPGIPTATPQPTAPSATTTRAPQPSATAGGGDVLLYAVAVVNVTGNTDPTCRACDGVYDDADRAAAAVSPLPALTFVVRTPGGAVARQTSVKIDRMQIAAFTLAAPGADGYDLALDAVPEGWQGCPNAPLVRHLDAADFALGNGRADFHLSNTCLPLNEPPLVPVAIPGINPTAAPVPTQTSAQTIYLPRASRGGVFDAREATRAGARQRLAPLAGGNRP